MTKKLLIMIALTIVQIAWGMKEKNQDTEEVIKIITKDNSNGIEVSKSVASRIPLFKQHLINNANNSIDIAENIPELETITNNKEKIEVDNSINLSKLDCATKNTVSNIIGIAKNIPELETITNNKEKIKEEKEKNESLKNNIDKVFGKNLAKIEASMPFYKNIITGIDDEWKNFKKNLNKYIDYKINFYERFTIGNQETLNNFDSENKNLKNSYFIKVLKQYAEDKLNFYKNFNKETAESQLELLSEKKETAESQLELLSEKKETAKSQLELLLAKKEYYDKDLKKHQTNFYSNLKKKFDDDLEKYSKAINPVLDDEQKKVSLEQKTKYLKKFYDEKLKSYDFKELKEDAERSLFYSKKALDALRNKNHKEYDPKALKELGNFDQCKGYKTLVNQGYNKVLKIFKNKSFSEQIKTIILADMLLIPKKLIDGISDHLNFKEISFEDISYLDSINIPKYYREKIVNIILESFSNPLKTFSLSEENNVYSKNYCTLLAFSPKGKYIALGYDNDDIKLWEFEGNKNIVRPLLLSNNNDVILKEIVFDPKGDVLVARGQYDSNSLYFGFLDIEKNQKNQMSGPYRIENNSPNASKSFNVDATTFAFAKDVGEIKLLDVSKLRSGENLSSKGLLSSLGSIKNVCSLAFSKEMLAAATTDRVINLWNIESRKLIRSFVAYKKDNSHSPLSLHRVRLKFNHDGDILASIHDKCITLWDAKKGTFLKKLKAIEVSKQTICKIDFSRDGKTLASGSSEGEIKFWNVKTGECIRTLNAHKKQIADLAFNQKGTLLASTSTDQNIKLWEMIPQISFQQAVFIHYFQHNNGKVEDNDTSKSLYRSLPSYIKGKLPAPSQSSWIGKGVTDISLTWPLKWEDEIAKKKAKFFSITSLKSLKSRKKMISNK